LSPPGGQYAQKRTLGKRRVTLLSGVGPYRVLQRSIGKKEGNPPFWGRSSWAFLELNYRLSGIPFTFMDTFVDPQDLTFSYKQFEKPLTGTFKVSDGSHFEWVLRGRINVQWISPTGKFNIAWAVEDDATLVYYMSEPELREMVAQRMANAYDQHLAMEADKK
jgi:hypothetical protein